MYVLVLITTSSIQEAKLIADDLVERRLVACTNIIEKVHSTYWWKGVKEASEEVLLMLKSNENVLEELTRRIRELHSYENPEIIALPIIGGSDAYLRWIGGEIR
jgi:periplasmic divalent cation tolerance protein|tara:strand:+ start:259 stop:570 length:312 start_codon:yes stop_codon:yes gene_type:complete